ncbi:MAG: hypothetical protein O7A04_01195 [Acidobacteria bacterium]|nr:hypothetical protein [Acidobacteriota bacterium]
MTVKIMAFGLIALTFASVSPAGADSSAGQAFARLEALVGRWQGENEDGEESVKTYRMVANGTVLHEEYEVVGRDDRSMTTMLSSRRRSSALDPLLHRRQPAAHGGRPLC